MPDIITQVEHKSPGSGGVLEHASFKCPVCGTKVEQPPQPVSRRALKVASAPILAFYVDHDAGEAYCCSEACAKMFAAHCDMPEPRMPLAGSRS